MPENDTPFESWAIVEIMGHKKFAGFVGSQVIAGAALVRVDVPATDEDRYGDATAAYTKLIGVGSIYCITPCTEAVARRAAREIEKYNDPLPVSLPEQRQLAAVTVDAAAEWGKDQADGDDEDDEFDGDEVNDDA